MEFLGIGPLELLLIVVLALIIVGPRDLAKFARQAGQFLNRMYRSPTWRTMTQASKEIRNLPNRLAREAELTDLDSLKKDLQETGRSLQTDLATQDTGLKAWTPQAQADKPAEPTKSEPPPDASS